MSHVIAISGTHVVYIMVAVKCVLYKIIKSKKIINMILIIFLIFFAIFTGGSASCVRACIMMEIILISEILYRRNDFFTTWCISLGIILLINFYNIENIGMWLSFMCVLGMQKLNLKDSFAVQFAIFPIILYSFNTVSLTFFISNFFASFIVGSILILGYISLALGKYFKFIVIIEELLLEIMELSFAINDLNLYLDLHPEDSKMLKKFNELVEKSCKYEMEYVKNYGPLEVIDSNSVEKFEWINNPWPWDNEGGTKYV